MTPAATQGSLLPPPEAPRSVVANEALLGKNFIQERLLQIPQFPKRERSMLGAQLGELRKENGGA